MHNWLGFHRTFIFLCWKIESLADSRRANTNLRYRFKARSNAIGTLLAAHTRFAEQIKVSPIKTRGPRRAGNDATVRE